MSGIIPIENITGLIYLIRGKKVMLDRDLANLYGVETKRLKEQVKRNIERFPEDFMFELSKSELLNWRSQFATSNRDKLLSAESTPKKKIGFIAKEKQAEYGIKKT